MTNYEDAIIEIARVAREAEERTVKKIQAQQLGLAFKKIYGKKVETA